MNELSLRLKSLRGTRNQAEFAEFIGISTRSLSRYENGTGSPDLETIQGICAKTGVDPTWLAFGVASGSANSGTCHESVGYENAEAQISELKARIALLEAENLELKDEAMALYKDALSAYKRLYEALATLPPKEEGACNSMLASVREEPPSSLREVPLKNE